LANCQLTKEEIQNHHDNITKIINDINSTQGKKAEAKCNELWYILQILVKDNAMNKVEKGIYNILKLDKKMSCKKIHFIIKEVLPTETEKKPEEINTVPSSVTGTEVIMGGTNNNPPTNDLIYTKGDAVAYLMYGGSSQVGNNDNKKNVDNNGVSSETGVEKGPYVKIVDLPESRTISWYSRIYSWLSWICSWIPRWLIYTFVIFLVIMLVVVSINAYCFDKYEEEETMKNIPTDYLIS
jgi:hypothetical protein